MLPQDHARAIDFEGVLRYLRRLGAPCEPPIGVGSFLLLYASDHEVVVWYSPAREAHREGEVAIPCSRLAAAWKALTEGETLDEAALERIGGNAIYGRWLLGLLAQIPGVTVRVDPLTLLWSPPEPEPDETPAPPAEPIPLASDATITPAKRRGRKRADVAADLEAAG
ncbi:MAG: hypothetical protein ACXWQ5_10815 [Ktedonobacterales bacterium]